MKRVFVYTAIVFTLGLSFASLSYAEPKACDTGTEELLETADGVLNSNYKRILKLYGDDPIFIAKFKNSQRAWLKFRDAELAALFPHATEDPSYYGSSLGAARTYWLTKLTEQRSMELVRWLEGVEEGDVYAGSIKTKPVK